MLHSTKLGAPANRFPAIILRVAAKLFAAALLAPTIAGQTSQAVSGQAQSNDEVRPITPGQTVERELRGGETQTYSITLRQGQFLRIKVEQSGIDVAATLRSAAGAELVKVNLLVGFGPEPISYEAVEAGKYRLEVQAVVATALSGHYSVSSTISASATAQDRARQAAERGLTEAVGLLQAGGLEKLRLAITKIEQNATQWRKLDDQYWLAYALNQTGLIYHDLDEQEKALDYYNKALSLRRAINDSNGEANTLFNIGRVYDDLRERQKALNNYNEALRLFKAVGNRSREAATLNNIGIIYNEAGEQQKALEYYNQALSLYETIGEPVNKAQVLNNAGNVHTALGERQKALDYYLRTLPLYKSAGVQSRAAVVLINIGKSYYYLGERQKSLDSLNQALTLYRAVGERSSEANTLRFIGYVYDSLGEKQKALDYYRQALSSYRAIGDRHSAVSTLENIGRIYLALGNNRKVIESFQETLPLWKAIGDRASEAETLSKIGKYYSESGKNRKALNYFNQALSLHRIVGNREAEAYTLEDIGRAYDDLGDRQKALKYYEQTLTLSRTFGYKRQEAVSLTDIGNFYSQLGRQQKSIKYYEQALPIWRAAGDKQGEAITLGNLASNHLVSGAKQKALEYFTQALPLYQLIKDQKGEIQTLNNIAETNLSLGAKQKALEAYQQTSQLQKGLDDQQGEATTLIKIGDIYHDLGDDQKELEYSLQALPLWKATRNRAREAETLNDIGAAYQRSENYQSALEHYQRALPLWKDLKDRGGEAKTLNEIGVTYFAWRKRQEALNYFRQALSLRRAMGDHVSEARTLIGMGLSLYFMGERQAAWEHFGKVLPLLKYPAVRAVTSDMLINGTTLFLVFEDYQGALEFYQQVLSASREIGDRMLRAAVLTRIGGIYSLLDDKPEALNFLQQGISLYRAMGDRHGEAAVLNEIGNVYMTWLNPSSSPQLQRGESKNPAIALDQIEADNRRMAVEIQQAKDNARRANEYFYQALSIYQAVKDRKGEARTLSNIGTVYQILNNNQEALSHFRKALFLVEEAPDPQIEMEVSYRLMMVWTDLSNPRLAIFFGKRAINRLQSLRAGISKLDKEMEKSFVRLTTDPYRELASLLIGQGRIAEAEQVLAMLKEEEYFEYVRRDDRVAEALLARANLSQEEEDALKRYKERAGELTRLGSEYAALDAERVKWPANRPFPEQARLDELGRLLADAEEQFQRLLEMLKAEFGQENIRVKEVESGLQKDLKAWGDAHVAAIYTIVGEKNLTIVVMTAGAKPSHTIPISAVELNQLIGEFRAAVTNPAVDPRPSAQKLYDVLVKPIESDLEGIDAQTLLWSLDGALRYVPVAALYDGKHGYLAERYANVIITLASRTNLGLQPAAREHWQVLGLGVSKEYENFGALTEVPEELCRIVHESTPEAEQCQTEIGVLDGHRLLDEQFTFTAFKNYLGRYPLVHIASHFSFKPGKENDSFLLLGGGNERKLTIDKIRKGNTMFNGVELLTLSACDTATGGVRANGEEVESFGVLAQEQGAKAVMATLWQVADPSTRELMVKFYELYSTTPNITKAEALRQGQLSLLSGGQQANGAQPPRAVLAARDQNKAAGPAFIADPQKPYAHQYYWAPFILIGNWR